MGLLDIFNYGTGGSYYDDRQKEREKRYRTLPVAGGKVDMTIDRRNQNVVGATQPDRLPPGMNIRPIQKPFHPSQGGTQQNLAGNQDLKWWEKLGNMAGVDLNKANAQWKDKGGFEGLMANPAFTMGLAFMQAGAEGKTLGQGSLDNVMKAAGISSHYKKILEDRKQEPIQATAADIDEVKTMLDRVKLKEPNMWEKALGFVTGDNVTAKYDRAAEAVAIAYQVELQKMQAKNFDATGKPLIIDDTLKERILKKVLKEKRVKQKDGWAIFGPFTSGTIQKESTLPKFKAQGGPVTEGQSYVVGEGGPEYFLPKESGKILSNDDSRIFSMLLAANPQLQNVSRTRSEKILRNRFPEYFD